MNKINKVSNFAKIYFQDTENTKYKKIKTKQQSLENTYKLIKHLKNKNKIKFLKLLTSNITNLNLKLLTKIYISKTNLIQTTSNVATHQMQFKRNKLTVITIKYYHYH